VGSLRRVLFVEVSRFPRKLFLRMLIPTDGRQPVYMASLPLVCLGSLGAAMSMNVLQLSISRTVQGFGASWSVWKRPTYESNVDVLFSVMAVGAATISDIYRLEERGTAMGVFFGVRLFAGVF